MADALRTVVELGEVSQATNMVFVNVPTAHVRALGAHIHTAGILAAIAPTTRLVTHLDVSRAQCMKFVEDVKHFFAGNIYAGGVAPKATGYATTASGGTK
jgi:threonine aldolase